MPQHHGALLGFPLVVVAILGAKAPAQDLAAFRTDQIARLQNYVLDAIQPSGLVRDSLVLNPAASSFHPATPDAAGFALVSLAAFDQLGTLPNAGQKVVDILRAYNGLTPGVTPLRSPNGHYLHFLDINTGGDPPGWDDSYSPIGSALVVAGAQFARNHFAMAGSPLAGEIDALTQTLTESIDFNAAIHPSRDGRVWLDMTSSGGGAGGAVRPWNEYQLVVSLALRQQGNNDRAVAVRRQWLNAQLAPKQSYQGIVTATDSPSGFAPAFWTQQAQFFNGDFRNDPKFQTLLTNQQRADRQYSAQVLEEAYRYGLTAGVSPDGYYADRILDHPGEVFSPEAVAAWGDIETLLDFAADQPPASDPRYRYGLVRVSDAQPGWVPNDAGLVDHLFLLFGLVESLEPSFFAERVFAPLAAGDFNFDGSVDAADYTVWRDSVGTTSNMAADADLDGDVDVVDRLLWATNYGAGFGVATTRSVPEPGGLILVTIGLVWASAGRRNR
ncbi:hypothetical protein Pla108_17970 [Botrimarina colliarenosi]|uniref:Uncharacterized protein n=1 Tax=Botrimarina colliarenosi TaxID=2528001 RepID=A0A5C6AEP5_9BACT|nr:PEP-CTERM sorting domain-containing protein [Botrimarina colliarenosi]TWT97645.1 hypothetical protein Pla108_17970 [Botrimarina colliarenosi]